MVTILMMMTMRRRRRQGSDYSAQVDRIIDAVGVENIRENVVMDKMQVLSPFFCSSLTMALIAQILHVLIKWKN